MGPRLLVLEPFYGGSHQQLVDALVEKIGESNTCVITLPDSKWHWRARTSALLLSQKIPREHSFVTLFASSVLSLAELLGLRPDLWPLKKVVYFHESQLDYPVRKAQERDFQYGYNQITTCLAADLVLFNSNTLCDAFLENISKHLKLQPDQRPDVLQIREEVKKKSRVCYFPLNLPEALSNGHSEEVPKKAEVHIVWPHRWEHDKDPEAFFRVIFKLLEEKLEFKVSVIGQTYGQLPEIFAEAREKLEGRIGTWGFKADKEEFYSALSECNVVVSTAQHETYGVAMLEAAALGCYPLVPRRLVYPELYPEECIYNTDQQLFKRLRDFCKRPQLLQNKPQIQFDRFAGPKPLQQLSDALQLENFGTESVQIDS